MATIKFIGVDGKYNFKTVLPFEVKRAAPGVLKDGMVLGLWLNEVNNRINEMKFLDNITEVIPVTEHVGKWVKGEYYAHEYPEGEEYADGKARRLKFKDASGAVVHQVYEVECLDKSKSVMDGYWEEAGGSRLYSGTGDEFTPFEKGLGL